MQGNSLLVAGRVQGTETIALDFKRECCCDQLMFFFIPLPSVSFPFAFIIQKLDSGQSSEGGEVVSENF